ncbi:hypothetical protein [Pelagibius sp. Alg239-R121]|uniref:hypothetical protein n=1 Tax=Pelagibius sp. Alg239-R121 TaxID=2993448 RepID=UPI0024A7011A|nr:hypothetical protein [Pelagibius sp. Alg239-R121]
MSNLTEPLRSTPTDPSGPRPTAGMIGFAIGAAAVLLVLMHFWAGPFAPQQSAGISIGEIAGEIRDSAARALSGEQQPEPTAAPWDIDRVLNLFAAVLAGAAIVLGLLGIVRRETWRPAAGAIALGASAVVFQFFAWIILIVVGLIVFFVIIQNLDGILSG